MILKPLFDRVVITKTDAVAITASGLVLPNSAQESPQTATVVAVGNGGMMDGKEIVMQVKIGDNVIYGKYAGAEVKMEGKEYIIIRQSDILAIVE